MWNKSTILKTQMDRNYSVISTLSILKVFPLSLWLRKLCKNCLAQINIRQVNQSIGPILYDEAKLFLTLRLV
jgi:hypothetical protein